MIRVAPGDATLIPDGDVRSARASAGILRGRDDRGNSPRPALAGAACRRLHVSSVGRNLRRSSLIGVGDSHWLHRALRDTAGVMGLADDVPVVASFLLQKILQ